MWEGAIKPTLNKTGQVSGDQAIVSTWELIHILFMTAVAVWLRFPALGTLSLYGDEDYTILAVQAILTDGFPHMPSGMGYWRATPYSYVAAASSWWFGLSAFSIRLPSVVFGVLTIPVFYAIAKRLTGSLPAVLATWLLVFSAWHVDVSREGRMYAMFLVFFLLSTFFVLKGFEEDRTPYKVLALFVSAVTLTLHHLGSLVIMVWLIPFFIRIPKRPAFARVTGAAAALTLLGFSVIHNRLTVFDVPGKNRGDMSSGLFSLLRPDYVPRTGVISHLFDHHPAGYACLVIITVALAVYFLKTRRESDETTVILTVGSLGILTLALLNLFGLIMLIALTAIFWYGNQIGILYRSPYLRRVVAVTAGIGIFWLSYGLFVWQGGGDASLPWADIARKTLKESVYYPALHVTAYISAFPVMAMIVLAGTALWSLVVHEGRSSSRPEALIFALFWLPLLALGFKKEWIYLRYTIMVYPFYLMIFSWTSMQALARLRTLWADSHTTLDRWLGARQLALPAMLIVFFLTVPFVNEEHSLADAYETGRLRYKQDISPSWHGFPFHPDHESAGTFVKSRLEASDVVIAMDVCEQYYYTGLVNYWLTSQDNRQTFGYQKDSRWYDIYTASPIVTTEAELEEILGRHADQRVWLVTSAEASPSFSIPLPTGRSSEEVFVGRDGRTKVYRFSPRS